MIVDEGMKVGIPVNDDRPAYWVNVMRFVDMSLDWAEFGTACGKSAKVLLESLPKDKKFYLFDSFKGLPTDWVRTKERVLKDGMKGRFTRKGAFACEVPVFEDKRVEIVQGWYKDTVAQWEHPEQLGLIHMDCDLTQSTTEVLYGLGDRIGKGTVIAFDEYFDAPYQHGSEFDAWHDYVIDKKVKFGYIGGLGKTKAAVVVL